MKVEADAIARQEPVEVAPPSEPHTPRFYLPELDSLRFCAFLAVFIHHIPVMEGSFEYLWKSEVAQALGNCGAFGVDLFFALSAYLITGLLLRERAACGKVDLKYFYLRRILRIWPLYFFFIALIFLISLFDQRFYARPQYYLSLLTFVSNFWQVMSPQSPLAAIPLLLLWSVSVEEQFYLLWSLAMRNASVPRIRLAALVMWSAAIATPLIAAWTHWTVVTNWGLAAWQITPVHLQSLAIGIALASVPYEKLCGLRSLSRLSLVITGIAIWFFAVYYCGLPMRVGSVFKAMAGLSAMALGSGAFMLASFGAGSSHPRIAANPTIVYFGKISYGLYVYHVFSLMLAKIFMIAYYRFWAMRWPLLYEIRWVPYIAISALLTFGMAACSYRWLESPFLKLKRRFTYVQSRPV